MLNRIVYMPIYRIQMLAMNLKHHQYAPAFAVEKRKRHSNREFEAACLQFEYIKLTHCKTHDKRRHPLQINKSLELVIADFNLQGISFSI